MNDLSSLFEVDERFIDFDEVDPADLLDQDGILACSRTLNALDIDRRKAFAMLRKEAKNRGGEQEYFAGFGIKKYGTSRWFVHMPTFRNFVDELKRRFPVVDKMEVKPLPKNISRKLFFNLEGLYSYRDVMEAGLLPFDPDQLLRQISSKNLTREETGVWKEGAEFIVDFRPFLVWAYALKSNLTIEESRKVIEGMLSQAT